MKPFVPLAGSLVNGSPPMAHGCPGRVRAREVPLLLLAAIAVAPHSATAAALAAAGAASPGGAVERAGRAESAQGPEQSAPRIAVLIDPERPEIARKLQTELEMLGFSVEPHAAPEQELSGVLLAEQARRVDAIAAVAVVTGASDVEVWIADRITGKTLWRQLSVAESDPAERNALIALRAVELLRASLLELQVRSRSEIAVALPAEAERWITPTATAAPAATGASPAAGAAPMPPSASGVLEEAPLFQRPALGLSLATLSPFGELGQAHLALHVEWMAWSRFGVGAAAFVPVASGRLESVDGEARFDARLLWFGPRVRLLGEADPVLWTIGASGGIALLDTRGQAEPPLVSRADPVAVSVFAADTLMALALTEQLRAHGSLLFGLAAPQPVIRFAGEAIASWGAPLYGATIGLTAVP